CCGHLPGNGEVLESVAAARQESMKELMDSISSSRPISLPLVPQCLDFTSYMDNTPFTSIPLGAFMVTLFDPAGYYFINEDGSASGASYIGLQFDNRGLKIIAPTPLVPYKNIVVDAGAYSSDFNITA